jgi:L-methionine (R)-S-oxide reductase
MAIRCSHTYTRRRDFLRPAVHFVGKLLGMDLPTGKIGEILDGHGARAEKARALAQLIQTTGGFHWVGLYDVSATEIAAIAWTGAQAPAFPTFPIDRGLNGAAVAQRKPVIVQDVRTDPRYLTTFGATRGEAIFPVLGIGGQRVVGTIDVESDRVNAFAPADIALLETFADLLRPLWR